MFRAAVLTASLAIFASSGEAIAVGETVSEHPLQRWTVGSWEVADHGKYCIGSSPSLMSGKTSLLFSMGGDGLLVALLANQTWQMKGTRVTEVHVSVDNDQHGRHPTKVIAPTVVSVELPLALIPELQVGVRATFQFDRASYSFPLRHTRFGLEALLECSRAQLERSATLKAKTDEVTDEPGKAGTIPGEWISKPAVDAPMVREEIPAPLPQSDTLAARDSQSIAANEVPQITEPILPSAAIDQLEKSGSMSEGANAAADAVGTAPVVRRQPWEDLASDAGIVLAIVLSIIIPLAFLQRRSAPAAMQHASAETGKDRTRQSEGLAETEGLVWGKYLSAGDYAHSASQVEQVNHPVDERSPPAPAFAEASHDPPSSVAPAVEAKWAPQAVAPAAAGKRSLAVVAALFAFVGVLALEILVLMALAGASGYTVTGPFVLLPPVMVATWAWRNVRNGAHRFAATALLTSPQGLNREGRFKLVLLSLWAIAYTAFWIIEEPHGYSFDGEDAAVFVWWLVVLPLLFLGAWKALRWAAAAPEGDGEARGLFGQFGDKRVHWMKRAERSMVVMGRAALANDLRTLHAAIQAQTFALGELHVLDVSEAEFDAFIKRRGRVAWVHDRALREMIDKKVDEVHRTFWP